MGKGYQRKESSEEAPSRRPPTHTRARGGQPAWQAAATWAPGAGQPVARGSRGPARPGRGTRDVVRARGRAGGGCTSVRAASLAPSHPPPRHAPPCLSHGSQQLPARRCRQATYQGSAASPSPEEMNWRRGEEAADGKGGGGSRSS